MKKLIALISIFTIAFSSLAENIDGIGEFKIGMPLVAFDTWLKFADIRMIQVFHVNAIRSGNNDYDNWAYEPLLNNQIPESSPPDVTYDEWSRVIILKKYYRSGINFQNLKFTFRNGVLIGLNTDFSSEFELALIAKYGEPEIKTFNKNISCRFVLTGASDIKTEQTKEFIWRNDNIFARGYDSIYFDNQCRYQRNRFFDIYDNIQFSSYKRANNEAKKMYEDALKKKNIEQLKETLDDL